MPQLARNVISMYLPRFAGIASSVFLFPFIAHEVDHTKFGLWLLVSSVAILFFTDFGIGVSAMRYVAAAQAKGDRHELNRVVSSTLAMFVALGVGGGALYAGVMVLLLPGLNMGEATRDLALFMIFSVTVTTLLVGMPASVFRNLLAGVHRYDKVSMILVAQHALRCAGIVVVLLVLEAGIVGVVVVETVVQLLVAVAFYLVARRTVPDLRIARDFVSWSLLRGMIRYSLQVFVIGIAALVIIQANNLIIGLFLPVAMVTLYTGAFRIYQVCRELTGSAMSALVPDASESAELGNWDRVRQVLIGGTKYSNAFILCLTVPAIVFAEPVLVAWAGEQFAEVAIVAQILLISLIVNNNHVAAASMMIGTGRAAPYAKLHATWALSNIALSIVLVQTHGLKGMALGTAIPILLLEPLYIRSALREFSLPRARFIHEAIVRPLVPAVVAGGALWAVAATWDPQGIGVVLALSSAYAVAFLGLFTAISLRHDERARFARWFGPLVPRPLAQRLGVAASSSSG